MSATPTISTLSGLCAGARQVRRAASMRVGWMRRGNIRFPLRRGRHEEDDEYFVPLLLRLMVRRILSAAMGVT